MAVVLVVRPSDEPSGHPVAPRFLRLLDDGWDAYLVLIGGGAERLEHELPAETLGRVRAIPSPGHAGSRSRRGRALLGPRRRRDVDDDVGTLRSVVIELGAELVHLSSAAIADPSIWDMNGLRSSIVVSFRGDLHEPGAYRELWERADALSFESEGMAQLAGGLGAPVAKTWVVPPVAELELVPDPAPREADRNSFRILSIGRLSWTRGYEHALVAVRLLLERGTHCQYRIVGQGDFADAVAFGRYQLGLEDTVEIVTPSGRDELQEHLAWADAFLNSAVIPTSPKHLIDAQASGVPVVTTEAPPAGPATALVAPARDPAALADALELIAEDPALRHRLAEEGREAARPERALTDQLDLFSDLYRSVLGRPPDER